MAGESDRPDSGTSTPGGSAPGTNEPDGQMDGQEMPTTDGEMASNGSEEVIPSRE